MSVNYDNLVVLGIRFIAVLKFDISQQVNDHATAVLHLEVNQNEGKQYMQEVHEKEIITIGTSETIFAGVIQKANLIYEDTYSILELELISTTILWDVQKLNKSYQRIGDLYSEIMTKATDGQGIIEFCGNDMVAQSMVVQYQETIWEFILRLASECGEPVYVDATSIMPHVIIGTRQTTSSYKSNITTSNGAGGNTSGYVSLGANASGGGNIDSAKSSMKNGELITTYSSASAEVLVSPKSTPKFAGRVMCGTVQAVNRDKVQVHITDLDKEYDGGSNVWFTYSTLYSSQANGAGIYCMPIVGDPVRVFFPSENLKDAFASSAYTVRGKGGTKEEKCFSTPQGMTVLFGKEGLFIYSNKKKTGIYLQKDGAITIESEQNISIHAEQNIAMMANEGNLYMESAKRVCMATGNSMIVMEPNKMLMVSDRIMTQ